MTMTTAVENDRAAVTEVAKKYLTFHLGSESYGLDVLRVREIIRIQPITPMPQMPPHVRGIINLRGKLIPVMDLRLRFGLQPQMASETTCIIVVQVRQQGRPQPLGVIVDGVEEVLQVSAADIEPPPEFGTSLENNQILGLAKVKGQVKALLDIDQVARDSAF